MSVKNQRPAPPRSLRPARSWRQTRHWHYDAQRRFIADAAHQLRTPLALQTSQIEYARYTRLHRQGGQNASLRRACMGLDLAGAPGGALVLAQPANLLDNALRYTQEGGRVTMGVRRLPAAGRAGIELWVEDNGPGIAPEARERVFDSFYRASHDTQGTGWAWPSCSRSRGPTAPVWCWQATRTGPAACWSRCDLLLPEQCLKGGFSGFAREGHQLVYLHADANPLALK